MAENSKMMLNTCMNEACRVTVSSGWKIGWELKSGGFATLCVRCGTAYENSTFCNIFHKNEEGWRGCRNCGKRVHCGCPASKMQLEILDLGGVKCRNCVYASSQLKDVTARVETGMKRKCMSEIFQSTQNYSKTQESGTSESQASNHQVPPPATIQSTTSEAQYHQNRLRARLRAMSGRGRNQILNQYRPRTTQQELQQISANLNSTIVPLFEKILSPTDVGRMDRLVLPKHCTEAYFPRVNELEGRPMEIQDVMGMVWTFLLRFWQNNGSRMYVLEGFSSFVNSMQLRAGDTVTFSRVDPGGQLVMGFRKLTRDSIVQASMQTVMNIGPSNTVIEPPVKEKTAIYTVKPSAPSSWAPNEIINPKGQAATLNEGSSGMMECTNNKDLEPSRLEILATTAILTENMENTEHPQLPEIIYID